MVTFLSRWLRGLDRSTRSTGVSPRRITLECLENRTLLSVASGSEEYASYPLPAESGGAVSYAAGTGSDRLFALRVTGTKGQIHELDPATGGTIANFDAPGSISNASYVGLASAVSGLFFMAGNGSGPHTLYEINPDTGAVIDSDLVGNASDPGVASLACLNGLVYMGRPGNKSLLVWDPVGDSVVKRMTIDFEVGGGLTGAGDRGVLYASGQSGRIAEISPSDGALRVFTAKGYSYNYAGGLAYVDGQLLAADRDEPYVYRIDPSTGTMTERLSVPGSYFFTGLAGDGAPQVPAEIRGSVWRDVDGDRLWDDGEPGTGDWTVFLDDNENGIRDLGEQFAQTAEDGSYVIAGVLPGTHAVATETPAYWVQTSPGESLSQGRLFAVRLNSGTGVATIVEFNPDSGAIINEFSAPGTATSMGPQGLATGRDRLYYFEGSSRVLYELDLNTGTVIDSQAITFVDAGSISGLAYLKGMVYLLQHEKGQILRWDPLRKQITLVWSFSGVQLVGSLTGAAADGALYCSNGEGTVFRVDPTTGKINRTLSTGIAQTRGGLACAGGDLLIGPLDSSGTVYRVDPVSGGVRGTLALGGAQYGKLVGLGGDGAAGASAPQYVNVTSGAVAENVNFGNSPIDRSREVVGTEGADVITVIVSDTEYVVRVNGAAHAFERPLVNEMEINGLGGRDKITIVGTGAGETVTLDTTSAEVIAESYQIRATSVERILVDSGEGNDRVTMIGSAGANRLYSYSGYTCLTDSSQSYSHRVDGFEAVEVSVPAEGRNHAFFYGSSGDDELIASPNTVELNRKDESTGRSATGFTSVYVYATDEGNDTARLTGATDAANHLYSYADYAIMTDGNRSYYFYARGFNSVTADSPGHGSTYAYFYDSPGADTFQAAPATATMNRTDSGKGTTATGFNRIYAYSTRGGDDTAILTGSEAGGNRYRAYPAYATLTDIQGSFYQYAKGFHSVTAVGSSTSESRDIAHLYDSSGSDTFRGAFLGESGKYEGGSLGDEAGTFENWVRYFDQVYARSSNRSSEDKVEVDTRLLAYNLLRTGYWQ